MYRKWVLNCTKVASNSAQACEDFFCDKPVRVRSGVNTVWQVHALELRKVCSSERVCLDVDLLVLRRPVSQEPVFRVVDGVHRLNDDEPGTDGVGRVQHAVEGGDAVVVGDTDGTTTAGAGLR